MRRLAIGVVTVLALAGCSSSSQPGGSTSSAPTTASSPSTEAPPANPRLFERCGSDSDGISSVPFTFAAGDGTKLFGLELGGGPRGVLMVHELGNRGLCGWLWYGKYLAAHGLRVLLYDTRCTGSSSCPDGAKADDVVDDVTGAEALLERHGVKHAAVVGASFGGAIALTSAVGVPGLRACVVLSGDLWDSDLGPMSGEQAARKLTVPLFYGVATQDEDRLPTARRIVKLATHSVVTLKVIAGPDHGWYLLQDGDGRSTPLAAEVLAFLSAHLR